MLSASESSEVLCPSDVVAFEDLTIYSSILKRLPTATQFDRHLGVIKYRGRNPIAVTILINRVDCITKMLVTNCGRTISLSALDIAKYQLSCEKLRNRLRSYTQLIITALSNVDGNTKEFKTLLKLWPSVLLFYFAIIPTRLTCLMWPNCPGTEFVGMALKFRKSKKNWPSSSPKNP